METLFTLLLVMTLGMLIAQLVVVGKGNKFSFIEKSGNLVDSYNISAVFTATSSGADHKGVVESPERVKNKKSWGFIDTKGQIVGRWQENNEPFSK